MGHAVLYIMSAVLYNLRTYVCKMKVPELEEQQGRNIYFSIYLQPCCRERRPVLIKKKVAHIVRTNDKSQISVWANNDHILGRRVVRETA